MTTFSKTDYALRLHGKRRAGVVSLLAGLVISVGLAALPAAAQTAGEGTIQGTITDPTGAVIGNATVTATDAATNISMVRKSSSAGFFVIAPLLPGTYSITVAAAGFKTLVQKNIVVNALEIRPLTLKLAVGEATQTVSVTTAPAVLHTADATIGLTVQHQMFANLPLQMNGMQRDPTQFATLTPGAVGGDRMPVVEGTGNYLGQLYLDGMPAETVSQQGDNRLVSEAVDTDAVDQFQMVTSTPPAEYMGAGTENFTMKSGGLRYHGEASDFVRNTAFDAWSFTNKHSTITKLVNGTPTKVPAPKPAEHQNELSLTLGGPVPRTGHKLFFFFAYDLFHTRTFVSPSLFTVPTAAMRSGDFTQLAGTFTGQDTTAGVSGEDPATNPAFLYDPATNSCSGGACSRQPFVTSKNGVPTYNVIPSGDISPIAQKMESFLPAPSNSALANNYLGGIAKGFDNHEIDWRLDWDLSSNQRISTLGTMGVTNYLDNYGSPYLPLPYTGGDLANILPKNYMAEDDYTISPTLVNQLKFGFTRFFQDIHDSTQGVKQYDIGTMGVTNLPGGQAGEEFPGAEFGTTKTFGDQQQTWTGHGNSVSTQLTTPNNYALTDNLLWQKGRHALTIGVTFQWQEINNANPATLTGVLAMNYNAFSTADFSGDALDDDNTGYSYASFLLGAVAGSPSSDTSAPDLGIDYVSELAGRYKAFAPYVQDEYKFNSKLTLDLGLRWDYLPPFHELKNRWTFLNPNITNPLTGTKGMLQFAGSYGGSGVSCGCTTPVKTYFGNWGPRVGLAYTFTPQTVLRIGYAQVFSQGGGVGGRGGAYNGTGQTGFNTTAIGPSETGTGIAAGPSYFLNPNSAYLGGQANTDLFGSGYTYPTAPPPGVAAQELDTGYYVNGNGQFVSASGVQYADPYFSGRAPELELYNLGIEQAVTRNMTLAINYVGNESHFITDSKRTAGNIRGYWSNELDPKYLAGLGPLVGDDGLPLLDAPADPANVAQVMSVFPDAPNPAFFQAAAAVNSSATIAQMLVPFPQYSGVTDAWGDVGNYSYDALEVTLEQRMTNGLTFNFNFTWSKNMGDQHTFRSGYAIPADAISHGTKGYKMDALDRGLTTEDTPFIFHGYGVYRLPFGQGHIGGGSHLVNWLAGGWQLSGIYSYSHGSPVSITWSGCSGSTYPGQGQCMPDIATGFSGAARINGSYGKGPNGYQAASLGSVQYIDPTAFKGPQDVSPTGSLPGTKHIAQYLIGNAPVAAPYNLWNPGNWDLDMGLHRTFPLHWEGTQFIFEADCVNALNHVVFGGPNATWSQGSTSFGTVSGIANSPRDWQFAGHISF
ncbi:MAG: TonB-dependent receptor [Terracidiphilus sp.]